MGARYSQDLMHGCIGLRQRDIRLDHRIKRAVHPVCLFDAEREKAMKTAKIMGDHFDKGRTLVMPMWAVVGQGKAYVAHWNKRRAAAWNREFIETKVVKGVFTWQEKKP